MAAVHHLAISSNLRQHAILLLTPNFALMRQYGAEIWPKTIFSMAPVRHIGYCDVIILHTATVFYVHRILFHIQVDWLSTF